MGVKQQWKTIKDNWIIIVLVILGLLFMNGGGIPEFSSHRSFAAYDTADLGYYADAAPVSSRIMYDEDFAPEVEERKLTRSAHLSSQISRGDFFSAETRLKEIVSSSDSLLLHENAHKQGSERRSHYSGSYQLKVPVASYDLVVGQLKELGKVQSFSENVQDVTGQYSNNEINLEVEQARLLRYQGLYEQATDIDDKLTLNDRMFDQERRIKYLEDRIANLDQRIEYSTIHVSLVEKQSAYANVVLVKFSNLLALLLVA